MIHVRIKSLLFRPEDAKRTYLNFPHPQNNCVYCPLSLRNQSKDKTCIHFAQKTPIVDLPTRLAPSSKAAYLSEYFAFHSNNLSYAFRLKYIITSQIYPCYNMNRAFLQDYILRFCPFLQDFHQKKRPCLI